MAALEFIDPCFKGPMERTVLPILVLMSGERIIGPGFCPQPRQLWSERGCGFCGTNEAAGPVRVISGGQFLENC